MMGGIRITNKQTERGALMPMSQSDIAIACSKFDNGDDFNRPLAKIRVSDKIGV